VKFKFRLQSVYDLRQHMESEQKDELARERQKMDELVAEEQKLRESFALWSEHYMRSASTGISPKDAVLISNYLDELDKNIVITGRKIEQQNAVVERERLLLIERMKDRKTMDSLYDKQLDRFTYEQGRLDEKEIEELITSRH
jgi:flagellar FliJ protein